MRYRLSFACSAQRFAQIVSNCRLWRWPSLSKSVARTEFWSEIWTNIQYNISMIGVFMLYRSSLTHLRPDFQTCYFKSTVPIRNSNLAWQANPYSGKSWWSADWPSPLVGILWKYSWHCSHVTLLKITQILWLPNVQQSTQLKQNTWLFIFKRSIFVTGLGFLF